MNRRLMIVSRDLDAAPRGVGRLWARYRQHTIAHVGHDAIRVDGDGEVERAAEAAVATLDPVILFARLLAFVSQTRECDPAVVVHRDLKIVSIDAGQFRDDDVLVGRLEEIDRRSPPCRAGSKTVQALLNGEQVSNRIPARERHRGIVP